jgi:hypothetical protein
MTGILYSVGGEIKILKLKKKKKRAVAGTGLLSQKESGWLLILSPHS